ncbi:MAG TPA: hypothetical protein VL024_00665 [Castellaniella sp.]|nr:hypothetical protein [Castellaniella sp.]
MTSKRNQPGVYLWRGKTYIGQEVVARAAGVTGPTVAAHLSRYGNLDLLGVGRGNHGKQRATASRPITIGGREYPSIKDCALAHGIRPGTAQRWVRDGRHDRLLAALMAADARKTADAMREAQMIDDIRKDAA